MKRKKLLPLIDSREWSRTCPMIAPVGLKMGRWEMDPLPHGPYKNLTSSQFKIIYIVQYCICTVQEYRHTNNIIMTEFFY
jgi:hypothetical protein